MVSFGVTTTRFDSGSAVEVRELSSANSFPIVPFCKVDSEEISSNTLSGLTEVLVCAGREVVVGSLLLVLRGLVDLVALDVLVVLGGEII